MKKNIILVAGGTGGHILSALSLGKKLSEEYNVTYFTGMRTLDYKLFPKENTVHLNARPLKGKDLKGLCASVFYNSLVMLKVFFKIMKLKPVFSLGTGGYVCGPVLLTSWFLGRLIFLVEQNSVLGLTNKLLLPFAKKIFVQFKETKGLNSKKVVVSGNPINDSFYKQDFKKEKSDTLNVLVFGGSLGAESINNLVDHAFRENKPPLKFKVLHQLGHHQGQRDSNEEIQCIDFIDDMPFAYHWSDVIICRAGATTISELFLVRRPCILIPYESHGDRHQYINAKKLRDEVDFPVYIEESEALKSDLQRFYEILKACKEFQGFTAHKKPRADLVIVEEIKCCIDLKK